VPAASSAYHSILNTLEGVSISKRAKCTLSKTGCRADLLMWLPKGIEEKSFEARKIRPSRDPLL
jgi:hypothetical protein